MSLADKASLLLIPSGYIAQKVYSIFPTSGVGDFTFSRSGSATRIAKNGLITTVDSNIPRLEYPLIDGVVSGCPSLLLEPQSTNLILNSQKLSLTPIKSGTYEDNSAISPDGTQNATKLTATSTDPYFYQSVSFSAGSYTASIYVKGIGNSIGKDFQIRLGGSGSNYVIPSEWTRFEYTATMTSGTANCGIEIPDPAAIGDEVLMWGWQVEEVSHSTSLIKTQGSVVTREIDECANTSASGVIGQTEGVAYIEFDYLNSTGKRRFIFQLGTGGDTIYARIESNQTLTSQILNSGSGLTSTATSIQSGNNKLAIAYANNDAVIYLNGSQIAVTSSITIPSLSDIYVGNDSGLTQSISGIVKDFRLYKTRLSDSELEKISSWTSFTEMAQAQQYSIK